MTQPPVDPPEEPLGGALTPPPDEVPEPEAPAFEAPAAPPEPPPAYEPPPPAPEAPQSSPPPQPPAGSYPPPPPVSGAGAYPPPPPAAPGGYPMAPPPGAYPPAFPAGSGGGYAATGLKPHRATLVLGLGIVGLLCCGPLGILAYLFGKKDLEEMDAGVMDPSGRGTTNIGRILGIVAMVFLVLQVLYLIVAIFTGGLSG